MKKKEEDKVVNITGKAGEDLVEFTFNTARDKMLEMTVLGRAQALNLSILLTLRDLRDYLAKEADFQSGNIEEQPEPFFCIDHWSYYYMQAQRSVDGRNLTKATDMAQSKIESQAGAEDFEEAMDL